MTRLPHKRRAAIVGLLLLLRVHPPDDAAGIARGAVDLVQHAPGVGDVDEAVLDKRRRLDPFVAGGTAERHRIGELEVLDVVPVDAGERREALAVIGAVVHQPVLRLAVGIEEPFRRHVGRQHGRWASMLPANSAMQIEPMRLAMNASHCVARRFVATTAW